MSTAIYIHVPWCLQRCPYCDFATRAIHPTEIDHVGYGDAVLAELEFRSEKYSSGDGCTIFFGGGTPSLWDVAQLGRVTRRVQQLFGHASEVTVECNPTSLDREKAYALIDQGVNRLSIGVQSLQDQHLRFLGRMHNASTALQTVQSVASINGLKVSADLMFGMPEQQRETLIQDVRQLLSAGATHLSIYALSIEPATRFGELARKNLLPKLPDDDVATLFEALNEHATELDLDHYEVSNYGLGGHVGLHNQSYWRGDSYIGLGAGAVGCYHVKPGHRVRYRNNTDEKQYISHVQQHNDPADDVEELDAQTIIREGLMLGLRTTQGVELAALEKRAGCNPREHRERQIARAVEKGNLLDDGDRLILPQTHWLIADDIISSIF